MCNASTLPLNMLGYEVMGIRRVEAGLFKANKMDPDRMQDLLSPCHEVRSI